MSLRKIWLLILIVVSVTAISANTIILTFLTDRYFSDYLNESYELHVGQLTEYTTKALSSEEISYSQMAIELESHINDPIIEIKLYDPSGQLIIDVGGENYMTSSMMNNMMGGRMMDQVMDLSSQETRQIEISSDNQTLGIINITIHSLAENSFIARRFKSALLINSMFAIGIAIIAAVIIGMIISRKMSKSLKETEKLASDIQLGKEVKLFPSGIKEVNGIRESLMELYARLRMKQTTRKSLIDQLVHQTRTPLTILQTHLEAIEDGIIEVNTNELNVCQNQIKDIKSIISNMSSMIDAGSDIDELKIERFELYPLLRQIQQGLMAQFKKKQIQLELLSDEKIWMKTSQVHFSV
jgi:signal transduction histidine kinase